MNSQETNVPSTSQIEKVIALCKNPETEGFDLQAGETWVYPTNYTVREYQYNIIQEALLKNTMVSLPTGLGKTFIAAVVMYNFYRWYPNGKIIFMAPTRPLVKQQIDACYNIMAIPKKVTAELTGTKAQIYRKDVWKEKRVFFITPQILQNDLTILTELGNKIKCVVFDEAHKAKGNHAYCEVIRKLTPQNKYFRVLGLSATPGSTLQDVLEVIHNLLISHLEIRTDDSPDVAPYVFQRSLDTVVIPLDGKLQQVRSDYMRILETFTEVLLRHRVITGNCGALTKGKIFMTMKDYKEKSKNNRDRSYSEIMRNLNICITLYHGYELLIRHGLRGFLSFFEEHAEKPILCLNKELRSIMHDVSEYLGPAPNIDPLPDGSIAEIPESSKFGHPKFYKLRDILTDHFNENSDSNTRVIVFCEYRESVMEAYALLLRHKPLIRPRIFLGQGAITQKQQINVIKAFKQGECNTLISTCIGEEGLDVGDVDLIVCFDINNKSPVRMVQRMGRTGRKRQGRVVILVTEGKEQQTLKECLIHKQNLTNHILQSSVLYQQMYSRNPRMIPDSITPKCHKMFITVKAESTPQKFSRKKNSNLKDLFDNISNKKSNIPSFLQGYDGEDIKISNDSIPTRKEYFNKVNPLSIERDNTSIDFSKKLGKVRGLQPTGQIGHSKDTKFLVSLLQFAESKKFNIPMSQVPVMLSQMNQPLKALNSDGLKQTDIRNMFTKPLLHTEIELQDNDVNFKQMEEDITHTKQLFKMLHTEISTYLASTLSEDTNCNICENLFDCSQFVTSSKVVDIKNCIEPDLSIFNDINLESLSVFADSLSPESNKLCNRLDLEKTPEKKIDFEIEKRQFDNNDDFINNRNNDNVKLQPSPFKPPDNLENILEKCEIPFSLNDSIFSNIKFTQLEDSAVKKLNKRKESAIINVSNFDESLSFFKINTLEDIFEVSPQKDMNHSESQDTIIYTPDTKSVNCNQTTSSSPILCSYDKVKHLKSKVQKRLFEEPSQETNIQVEGSINNNKCNSINIKSEVSPSKPNLSKLLKPSNEIKPSFYKSKSNHRLQSPEKIKDTNNASDNDSVPDIIDTSLENIFESVVCTQIARKESKCKENVNKPILTNLKADDIADLSSFGFENDKAAKTINTQNQTSSNVNITSKDCVNLLQDFCDDSFLGKLFEDDPFKIKVTQKQNKSEANVKNVTQIVNINNQSKIEKFQEDEWEEESILNFCIGQTETKEDTMKSKQSQIDDKLYTPTKEHHMDIIDLTDDGSPSNSNVNNSPTLIKSQRNNNIFSHKLSQTSQSQKRNAKTSKLQLNSNPSITSMDWFKKINNKEVPTSSKTTTNILSTKHKSTNINSSPSKTVNIDEESDTDESFLFSFNHKKQPPPKTTRNLLSLTKVSPTITNRDVNNKTNQKDTLQTTPKKNKLEENEDVDVTPKRPKMVNRILESTDESDDNDFESPKRNVEWLKKKPTSLLDSKKSTQVRKPHTNLLCTKKKDENASRKNTKNKLDDCPYIDLEAELSLEDSIVISDDDDDDKEDNDKFEESFVDDEPEPQNIANNTLMHAHYLESVKSPLLNRGKFKIPERRKHFVNVYSQQVTETDNTYINDSFCVNTEDVEFQDSQDLSELELAEIILEQEKNQKKIAKMSNNKQNKKRRRILESSSSSDNAD